MSLSANGIACVNTPLQAAVVSVTVSLVRHLRGVGVASSSSTPRK